MSKKDYRLYPEIKATIELKIKNFGTTSKIHSVQGVELEETNSKHIALRFKLSTREEMVITLQKT